MKKILMVASVICMTLLASISYAGQKVAFTYNILPEIPNGYIVDSNHTNKINFSLFENEECIYLNDTLLEVEDDRFSISIEGLKGKQSFTLSNGNEEVTYTYYISDSKGYLEEYNMDGLTKQHKTYVKTIKNIPVIYTSKDSKSISKVEEIINKLPEELLVNLEEIKLVPAKHESNAAGITKYNKISFYNISKYSGSTLKNVVIHEIAHTWAYELIKEKEIDYSYTNYQKVVKEDNKFPSKYAKSNVAAGIYSEDFAESVSFYLINTKSFAKKYPARTKYIEELFSKYIEVEDDKKDS